MADGVKLTTVDPSSMIDEMIAVRDGSVVRIPIDNAAAQMAASGPLAEAKNVAQGRLSLSPVTPVPAADMTSAAIYYHPVGGNLVPIWDGETFVWRSFGNLLTMPLDGNPAHASYAAAGYNYDLYAVTTGGAVRLGHVGSWAFGAVTSPNIHKERSTGANSVELESINGTLVNKYAQTLRIGNNSDDVVAMDARKGTYLGTFRATANGQAKDTARQRLLYNAYNQAFRALKVVDFTSSWTYSSPVYRVMRNDVNNAIDILSGLEGVIVDLMLNVFVSDAATPRSCIIGLGIDSIVTPVGGAFSYGTAGIGVSQIVARFCESPGKGFTTLSLLERGAGAGTQTWWEGSGARGQVTL